MCFYLTFLFSVFRMKEVNSPDCQLQLCICSAVRRTHSEAGDVPQELVSLLSRVGRAQQEEEKETVAEHLIVGENFDSAGETVKIARACFAQAALIALIALTASLALEEVVADLGFVGTTAVRTAHVAVGTDQTPEADVRSLPDPEPNLAEDV